MPYRIKAYSRRQAKRLGVSIKPSKTIGKKIDVFDKKGKKLATIGAMGYGDYPTFMEKKGKEFADEKRRLYKQRHEKDRHKKGSAGYFADQILW